jgi:integrase
MDHNATYTHQIDTSQFQNGLCTETAAKTAEVATRRAAQIVAANALIEGCGVTGLTLHDLRRTARSLMSRVGTTDEHAEHTLGHKLQGVKKVYNRYDFFKEKSDALAKLAALIERILNPPPGNVVVLHEAVQS